MKNVLVFNDISGVGNCSGVANIALLSKLGHNVMPVATALYSCQTGFDGYKVIANGNIKQFSANVLANHKVDAVYVGFCNDTATLQAVIDVVGDLKRQGVLVVVDPIMGDNGKLYPLYDTSYVDAMKQLVALSDISTPNLTEACLLSDVSYKQIICCQNEPTYLATCGKTFEKFCKTCGCVSAVITGIKCGNLCGNVVLDGQTYYVTNERTDVDFSGTGDVFSSVITGEVLNGHNLLQATQVSANFVSKSAQATEVVDRRLGVDFAKVIDLLKKDY